LASFGTDHLSSQHRGHRRKISAPRAGSARVAQHWGDQRGCVDSDYEYEWQASRIRDNERQAVWKAEKHTALLRGESMRLSQGQKEGKQGNDGHLGWEKLREKKR
jgi:hypothetical protein